MYRHDIDIIIMKNQVVLHNNVEKGQYFTEGEICFATLQHSYDHYDNDDENVILISCVLCVPDLQQLRGWEMFSVVQL